MMKTDGKTAVQVQSLGESLQPDNGCSHFCHVHQDGSSLTAAAIRYLQLGAVSGESLVMITNKTRQGMILDWLTAAGVDVSLLEKQQRLCVRTSQEVVEALFDNGMPDWKIFEEAVTAVFDVSSWHGEKKIRFYGDAVSDLWAEGNHAGTIALEECWNRLKRQNRYRAQYFCGYVIDALSPQSYSDHLAHLGQAHCFVAPSKEGAALVGALDRAGREMLGITLSRAASEDPADSRQQHRLPEVFEAAMWLKRNHPASMAPVLDRAKTIYGASAGLPGTA